MEPKTQGKTDNTTIRILVIDDRMEDAEAIVTGLRNSGVAVRASRPTTPEELNLHLAQPVDMVLANIDSQAVPATRVVELARSTGRDLPVILLIGGGAALEPVLKLGAENMALRDAPGMIHDVVMREWQDLSARRALRRLETQVRETERRCDALIESSRDPIAYVHEGMHIRANQAYLEMFGYAEFEDVEGVSILDMVAPRDSEAFKGLLKSLSRGEPAPAQYELHGMDAQGHEFPAVMEFSPATYEGEPCQQIVFRRQIVDFDPEMAQQVEALKRTDMATGLLNRPTFLQMLDESVASAATQGQQHGFLLLQFDRYADLLGQVGIDRVDALMSAMAERILPVLSEGAQAGRFGENLIAVLLPQGDHQRTQALGTRLVQAIGSQILSVGSLSLSATASAGAVQITERNAQVPGIVAKANELLNSALALGGQRVEFHDPGAMDREEIDRINRWVERMRDALSNDKILLHYQPIISIDGSTEPFYDVLMRIHSEETNEVVAPMHFIEIAEKHGMVQELDRAVIEKAARTLADPQHAGKNMRFIARISRQSMEDETLPAFVAEVIQRHHVPQGRLALQISEAKVSTQLNRAIALSQHLKLAGCDFCVDQLGVGLNSLQLISHVKPRYVKLDGSFMTDYARSTEQQEKVKQLAEAAKEAGASTIAVELADPSAMTTLFMAGVEYVEGNFFAPTGPAPDYEF